MSRPRLLDLYCCQGGASAGYTAAGFDVTGVDKDPQPRYPYRFIQADALAYLRQLIRTGEIYEYTVVTGSPPCQRKTRCQKIRGREHPALIAPTRALMQATGLPYVIENVPPDGDDDDPLIDPIELCGAMFGLHTYRHRQFESNVALTAPPHDYRDGPTVKMGRPLADGDWYHAVGNFSNVPYVRRDLGLPWMNRDGLRESIPPAYTEHLGQQLRRHLPARSTAELKAA
ncbi:DNA methylase [Actinoplanes sp. M2I2]|uniref:DNA methylase n=1 Tax=Actinoplanes sp. M2I2 TaxID=1734444 RepID=UPI002021A188|nr:DNA methylase [Actinoplanes sp. M2I2]